ncbi:MAG: hypothetical protein ACK559_20870, partial [bacterium]
MSLQWMDNATKKMDSDIKSKYDSINNLHDMTLATRLFVLNQKVNGFMVNNDEKIIIDKEFDSKISHTEDIRGVNQVKTTTNRLNTPAMVLGDNSIN